MRRRGLLEEFLADHGHPFLYGDCRPSAADLSFDLTAGGIGTDFRVNRVRCPTNRTMSMTTRGADHLERFDPYIDIQVRYRLCDGGRKRP